MGGSGGGEGQAQGLVQSGAPGGAVGGDAHGPEPVGSWLRYSRCSGPWSQGPWFLSQPYYLYCGPIIPNVSWAALLIFDRRTNPA